MPDWKRTTKEVSWESLPGDLATAIRAHLAQYNLGPILSDALLCIQTDSEKEKQGLLRGEETTQMGVVLTPRWLVWAVKQADAEPAVLSAQLDAITVQDYAETPFVKMVPDSGMQVSGMFTDASESASAFIGVQDNTPGRKFKEALVQAVQDAKK